MKGGWKMGSFRTDFPDSQQQRMVPPVNLKRGITGHQDRFDGMSMCQEQT